MTIMGALADIRVDVVRIRELLEDDGGGRGRGARKRYLRKPGAAPNRIRSFDASESSSPAVRPSSRNSATSPRRLTLSYL
jgi:hypothetical protein